MTYYALIRSEQFVKVKIEADTLLDAVQKADMVDPTNIVEDDVVSIVNPLQQIHKMVVQILDSREYPIVLELS